MTATIDEQIECVERMLRVLRRRTHPPEREIVVWTHILYSLHWAKAERDDPPRYSQFRARSRQRGARQ